MSFYVIELLNKGGKTKPAEWLHLIAGGDVPIQIERELENGTLEVVDLIQRYDQTALQAICNKFKQTEVDQTKAGRWAGLLLDWDHFSSMHDQQSDAAGWIMELQLRDDGVWGRIEWSDKGEAAVVGKQYKFASVTHQLCDCEMIGNSVIRPLSISKAALTNEPRNRLLKPYDVALLNRATKKIVLDNNTAPGAKAAAEQPAANKEITSMDYKAKLCEMLKIPATSTDAEIDAAIAARATTEAENATKATEAAKAVETANSAAEVAKTSETEAKNKLTVIEGDVTKLKGENTALLNSLVDADLVVYKPVIADPVAMKKQLLANRDGTLTILKSLKSAARDPKTLDNKGENPGAPAEKTGIARTVAAMKADKK